MTSAQLAMIAVLLAAGSAQAQLVDRPTGPALETTTPLPARSGPAIPGFYAGSEGLPPADPKAPDYWRAEPKLYAGVGLNDHLAIEAKFTNPGYREGLRYRGHGPRLAQGEPLAAKGYNFDVVGRARVPVDERLDAFATAGAALDVRKYGDGNVSSVGAIGSVGANYKLNSKQTATAEIPLGVAAKRLSGARGGYGATLKLGF